MSGWKEQAGADHPSHKEKAAWPHVADAHAKDEGVHQLKRTKDRLAPRQKGEQLPGVPQG